MVFIPLFVSNITKPQNFEFVKADYILTIIAYLILYNALIDSANSSADEKTLMKLRALGFTQKEIAKKLKISQPAVSQRFKTIRKNSEGFLKDDTFLNLIFEKPIESENKRPVKSEEK